MYREDLDEFVSLFRGNCTNVTISDNQNRYESLDEMKTNIGSRIKSIEIRGEKPDVHFLMNQQQSVPGTTTISVANELRTEEITDQADALFYKIQDFLISRQRPRFGGPFAVLAIAGLVGSVAFTIHDSALMKAGSVTLGFLVCVFVTAGSIMAAATLGNYLSLETRLNSPSFWARHRDAFAAHAVTASISALLGGLAGWLACHYLK
jgi:hypothetical protein